MFGVISVVAPVVFAQSPSQRAGLELFEKKIRPALIEFCYECHSVDADDIGGDLLLDSRAGVLAGGESGAAIVAGKPRDSILMRAIEYSDLEMPPDEKLPDSLITDFRRWIALGAPDPRNAPASKPADSARPEPLDLWSLHPIVVVNPPPVNDTAWPRRRH